MSVKPHTSTFRCDVRASSSSPSRVLIESKPARAQGVTSTHIAMTWQYDATRVMTYTLGVER